MKIHSPIVQLVRFRHDDGIQWAVDTGNNVFRNGQELEFSDSSDVLHQKIMTR